jgi:putative flippase GtrA
MLQGYSPELVSRIGLYGLVGVVGCLLVMALFLLFLPYGWPVRIAAAIVWIVPVALGASFLVPGLRLALKDRRAEPRMVQGQLVGASEVSTSLGLGMLMIRTRGGNEQYLVPADRLAKVPGNQVTVMLSLTPNLRHVRSVGVMGQRVVGRPEQPVPAVLKRMRLLPIATPVALSAAAIAGADSIAAAPIFSNEDPAHALLAILVGALLAGAVYGISFLVQRRMYAEVQKLIPGGLG